MRSFYLLLTCCFIIVMPGTAWSYDFFEGFKEIRKDLKTKKVDSIVWENDAFRFRDTTDQYYTNGTMLERQYVSQRFYLKDPSGRLVAADPEQAIPLQFVPLVGDGTEQQTPTPPVYRQVYGIHLGQNLYTPSDISLTPEQLDSNDRPYGAWLYLGIYRQVISASGEWWKHGLDIGCIGPCAQGEWVQKTVHDLPFIDAQEPQGWSSQIKNEPGFVWFYTKTPVVFSHQFRFAPNYGSELAPNYRLNVGNVFFNGTTGARLRLGRFNTFFRHPYFNPNSIEPSWDRLLPGDTAIPEPKTELYVFLTANLRYVLYNALIEGPLFRADRTPDLNAEPFVLDYEAGFAFNFKKFSLIYSQVWRSTEVKEQKWSVDQHRFGRFAISWICDFFQ